MVAKVIISNNIICILQDCVVSVKHNWEWLTAVANCLPVHLKHSADYHQVWKTLQNTIVSRPFL